MREEEEAGVGGGAHSNAPQDTARQGRGAGGGRAENPSPVRLPVAPPATGHGRQGPAAAFHMA